MSKAITASMNYVQFALALGKSDRLTREASEPFRDEYANLPSPEAKAEYKSNWIAAYIQGNLGYTEAEATSTVEKSRWTGAPGKRRTAKSYRTNAEQEAYARGRQQFKYHVESSEKAKGGKQQAADPVSKFVKSGVKALADLSKAQQRKALAKLAEELGL